MKCAPMASCSLASRQLFSRWHSVTSFSDFGTDEPYRLAGLAASIR
jgi:hypothetical protein